MGKYSFVQELGPRERLVDIKTTKFYVEEVRVVCSN
jgi:hypothetical protein